MESMPNFLIIGTAKAGTTSLWLALREHPEIFMSSVKEPRFFAFEGKEVSFDGPAFNDYSLIPTITNLADYRALFAEGISAKARGEASTVYLYYQDGHAAERIYRHCPDMKLIAILRQPARRAFSNFVHAYAAGYEPYRNFSRALEDEENRKRENWSPFLRYCEASRYFTQLKAFYALFPRHQIHVVLFEDLLADPHGVLKEIFRFLEVDEHTIPAPLRQVNMSRYPRNRSLHLRLNRRKSGPPEAKLMVPARRLFTAALNRINLYRPALDRTVYWRLTCRLKEEILGLQDLIHRDLRQWMSP